MVPVIFMVLVVIVVFMVVVIFVMILVIVAVMMVPFVIIVVVMVFPGHIVSYTVPYDEPVVIMPLNPDVHSFDFNKWPFSVVFDVVCNTLHHNMPV